MRPCVLQLRMLCVNLLSATLVLPSLCGTGQRAVLYAACGDRACSPSLPCRVALLVFGLRTFHTRERSGGQRGVPRVDAAAVAKEGLQGAARGGGQRGAPRRRGGGQKGAPRRRGPAAGKDRGSKTSVAVHGFAVARPRGRAVYGWLVRSMRQATSSRPLSSSRSLSDLSRTCGCASAGWLR